MKWLDWLKTILPWTEGPGYDDAEFTHLYQTLKPYEWKTSYFKSWTDGELFHQFYKDSSSNVMAKMASEEWEKRRTWRGPIGFSVLIALVPAAMATLTLYHNWR